MNYLKSFKFFVSNYFFKTLRVLKLLKIKIIRKGGRHLSGRCLIDVHYSGRQLSGDLVISN